MSDDLLYFNGVNGATGDYGLPPMSGEDLASVIQGEADEELLSELKYRTAQKSESHFGVKEGVDPKKLDESGWGVLFTHDADPAVREALEPLLNLRREQAGERYRCYEKGDAFRVGKDNKNNWLARHGAGPGPVDPEKVPYYVLIVGSPEKIPYRFQSQLDVQFAVGRIDFGDDLDAYDNYARSVVAAETGQVELGRKISFFGVANEGDAATNLANEHLVSPILDHLGNKQPSWEVASFLKDRATKSDLGSLLGGDETPSLLFTTSHGMEFPMGDPRQLVHQGALLCQDWPGPQAWQGQGPIPQDHYFASDDLPQNANLLGLIGFFFACYGCGTPRYDEFAKQAFKDKRAEIAPHAFLADLPSRMLSNPGGGALAVIGHVERAWGCSFVWKGAGSQTTVFESTLDRLLGGHPVGSAIEYFNERYAELSTVLSDDLEEMEFGVAIDPFELAAKWTANNDARGYMVIGDPAVRLPVVAEGGEGKERPVIELQELAGSSVDATPTPTPTPTPAPAATPAATPAPTPAPAETMPAPGGVADLDPNQSFGIFGGGSKEPGVASEPSPIQGFLQKIGDFMAETVNDAITLEVDTYVSREMEQVRYENGEYTHATLRASTRIKVDGDTQICVPQDAEGKIDAEMWALHMEAVQQAQDTRTQMIRTALDAASGFLGVVKGV
jgi:hypothetical protein